MNETVFTSESEAETLAVGQIIATGLRNGDVLCLHGDLGAGKTTLMKGIAKEYTGIEPSEVTSPTFTYLHIYSGKRELYHFDLYRLPYPEDFITAGFPEFLSSTHVCCIEWPEKAPSRFLTKAIRIEIVYTGPETRTITVTSK